MPPFLISSIRLLRPVSMLGRDEGAEDFFIFSVICDIKGAGGGPDDGGGGGGGEGGGGAERGGTLELADLAWKGAGGGGAL